MLRRSKVLLPRLAALSKGQQLAPIQSTLASAFPTEEAQSGAAPATSLPYDQIFRGSDLVLPENQLQARHRERGARSEGRA